jgi:16S rRNA G966 N2-methylase RsmD
MPRVLLRAVGRIARAVVELFERFLGVRTAGDIRPQELGYPHGLYRPSSWLVLRELFRSLEVAETDTFVDIGSGLGRVVFMAARRPFKRVIGVERSEQLNEVAEGNIARNRHRLVCTDIEFVSVDALQWEIPGDVTVVYLFSPFPTEVLAHLVERLVASVERTPRPMRVILNFSTKEDRDVLIATGQVQKISFRVPWYLRSRFEEVSMFRLLPSGWNMTSC